MHESEFLAAVKVVTFQLEVMTLAEEGYRNNSDEWACNAERQLKQRMTKSEKIGKRKIALSF